MSFNCVLELSDFKSYILLSFCFTMDGDNALVKDGWYTLNGVKLQGVPTEKGIYIRNGKKMVIK